MRLWTIQPEELYQQLITEKVIHCNPLRSEGLIKLEFGFAYDWMAEQMKLRIGAPPPGVKYPMWAWHTLNWKHQKPDLRRIEFRYIGVDSVCIELEVPENKALLSDEELWHFVLNDIYYSNSTNEEDFNAEYSWFESLPLSEQKSVKEESWKKIFRVSTQLNTEWARRGEFIQATFWELRLDQIISVRRFKGRSEVDCTTMKIDEKG